MSALDQIKEVPRGDSPPPTSRAANTDNADFIGTHNSPQISPALPCLRSNRARHGSTASHISVDYFDPDGVQELRRTLTRMTTEGPEIVDETQEPPATSFVGLKGSEASESTLAPQVEGPFDFANTLRDIVEKYALLAHY